MITRRGGCEGESGAVEESLEMIGQSKRGFVLLLSFLIFSFVCGFALYYLLQLVHSFYEEVIVAFFIGVFSFFGFKKPSVILSGGIVGIVGWAVGLQLSIYTGLKFGISFGVWFLTSLSIFLVLSIVNMKKRKYFKSCLVVILGIFIGFMIEILQMLPAFISVFKFQDFQAFAVISATTLIIPLANVVARNKEERHEIKDHEA